MWSNIFFALSAIVCALCLLGAVSAALSAKVARALLLRKLHSCESLQSSQADSIEELRTIVEKVAQSQKMARVRRATTHAVGSGSEPDARLDPEAWRAWKNSQLRAGKVN